MTNYSRSVLKSNGFHHSENLPVKFVFSSKTVPVNIAKKLPSQTLSQTTSHRTFQLLTQTPHVCFHRRKRVHTRPSEKNRTQGLTRRNRGLPDGAAITILDTVLHVHEHPRAGCQNGVLCRFWVLAGGALEKRREPAGQRCVYARRCPEASRPRWAA